MKEEEGNSRIQATCCHLRGQFHFAQADSVQVYILLRVKGTDKDVLEGNFVSE